MHYAFLSKLHHNYLLLVRFENTQPVDIVVIDLGPVKSDTVTTVATFLCCPGDEPRR